MGVSRLASLDLGRCPKNPPTFEKARPKLLDLRQPLRKKIPRSAVLKQAYRNPALARTVPSPTVRAPSILIAAAARNAPVGCEGRSASSRRKSGLLFTLCGFLRSSLSRTPQGRFCMDGLTRVILRRIKYRRIRHRRYRRFCRIRRRLRLFREHPRRFRQQRT